MKQGALMKSVAAISLVLSLCGMILGFAHGLNDVFAKNERVNSLESRIKFNESSINRIEKINCISGAYHPSREARAAITKICTHE